MSESVMPLSYPSSWGSRVRGSCSSTCPRYLLSLSNAFCFPLFMHPFILQKLCFSNIHYFLNFRMNCKIHWITNTNSYHCTTNPFNIIIHYYITDKAHHMIFLIWTQVEGKCRNIACAAKHKVNIKKNAALFKILYHANMLCHLKITR